MTRRVVMRALAGAICALTFGNLRLAVGEEVGDLKQKLEVGLRPRLQSEFDFIARVVELVELNGLPMEVVLKYFQWARKKYRPMPYFEKVIRDEAERRGVEF
jgi:hypothetical protein